MEYSNQTAADHQHAPLTRWLQLILNKDMEGSETEA